MDVVYAFAYTPQSKTKQLVYSLRSIEKHLKGFRNVYIIGADPALPNTIHIPATDLKSPATNIKDKLLIACNHPDISEDFLYISDDHYLLQDQEISTYPNYISGMLLDLARIQKNAYKQYVANTARLLGGGVNYNVHAPIIYNKAKLIEAVNKYPWNQLGFIMKSLYGNVHNLPGTTLADLKISRNIPIEEMMGKISGRPVFSSGKEWEAKNVGLLLAQLFPDKSKFEA